MIVSDISTVAFSDGTVCDLLTSEDTKITCLVAGFDDATLDTVNPYTVSITVNSISDATQTVTLLTDKQIG